VKSNHLAAWGIHGAPDPLLVGLPVDKASHFTRFHLQAFDRDVRRPARRLDVKVVWQSGNPLPQKPQSLLECASHCATDATQRDSFHPQAFDQPSGVIRDEVLFEAVDKLTAAGMAMMVLFAVMDVAIFLVFGRSTPWTHVSDDHRLLLTSAGGGSVLGQQ
jgi:hypothetical protein